MDLCRKMRLPKNALVISFDDGYANNLHVALPVLKSLDIPSILYLSTQFIGGNEMLPTTVARLALRFTSLTELKLTGFDQAILLRDPLERETALARVSSTLKKLPGPAAERVTKELRALLSEREWYQLSERFQSERFLSWDEVRELARAGVAIGAHGHSHLPLHAGHDPVAIEEQVILSRQRVETEIGSCHHFAYPNGGPTDICRGAVDAIRRSGFRTAASTYPAVLSPHMNPLILPRICAYDMRSIHRRSLRLAVDGASKGLKNWADTLCAERDG